MTGFQALHFILELQLPPFDLSDVTIRRGGRCKCFMKLGLEISMLLFQRCKMSLNGHMARPSLCSYPQQSPPGFQVYDGSVTRVRPFVEGENVV